MNVAVTRAGDSFPRRAFTVGDIRRMMEIGVIGEDEKFELIEGDLVMAAAKGFAHEAITSALARAVFRAASDDMEVRVDSTIQFSDNVIVEPDIAIFPRRLLLRSNEDFALLKPGDLWLAIEIAVSSLRYDRGPKARLYARHGVREFWVIDANRRVTWVHTAPTGDTWSSVIERGPAEALTTPALPGFAITLSEVD